LHVRRVGDYCPSDAVRLSVERVVRVLGVELDDVFRVFADLPGAGLGEESGRGETDRQGEGKSHDGNIQQVFTCKFQRAATLCVRRTGGGWWGGLQASPSWPFAVDRWPCRPRT